MEERLTVISTSSLSSCFYLLSLEFSNNAQTLIFTKG